MRYGLPTAAALVAALSAAPAPAQDSASTDDSLVALVQEAIELHPDTRRPSRDPAAPGVARDDLLSALRLMRDPALRPLFQALAESDNPSQRLHGVLGAAELDRAKGGVDPFLLKAATTPTEQALIFSAAARAGLADAARTGEVLAWDDLAPELEIMALAQLARLGEPLDQERLRRLSRGESLPVAAMAAILLLEARDDAAAPALDRFFADPASRDPGVMAVMLQHIGRHKLSGAAPFAVRALEAAGASPIRLMAIQTLLAVDPPRGAGEFAKAWRDAGGLADKLFLTLAALEAAPDAPRSVYELIRADDSSSLLRALGDAGLAVSAASDAPGALAAVAALGHGPSLAWAVDAVEKLPADQRTKADAAIVRAVSATDKRDGAARAALLPSAARLAEAAPQRLEALIRAAAVAGDDALTQSLLAGALRASITASPVPADIALWPSPQCRALATILTAKAAPSLTAEQQADLRRVATGAELSQLFRVQAAWLALRHAGQDRICLAKVLAPDDE